MSVIVLEVLGVIALIVVLAAMTGAVLASLLNGFRTEARLDAEAAEYRRDSQERARRSREEGDRRIQELRRDLHRSTAHREDRGSAEMRVSRY